MRDGYAVLPGWLPAAELPAGDLPLNRTPPAWRVAA
jgi:hypothetical protein